MSLRRIDLNLLPIFDVLIEVRNTTHAAARLSMSQPAVSHALSRLRKQLDDPILVRGPQGMEASPRALQVHQEIHRALQQIEHTLVPESSFDPATSARSFSVATVDFVEAMLLPPLLARIQEDAPGIELMVRHLPSRMPLEKLDAGEIDLALGLRQRLPKRYCSQHLLQDGYLCAVSTQNPIAKRELTLELYTQQQHLVVAPPSQRRAANKILFSEDAPRPKIVANSSHFLVALHAASQSNLIITGPALLLRQFQSNFDLHLMALPFDLEPFEIAAVWHPFKDADPGLIWLRSQLGDIAASVQGDVGKGEA